MKIVFACTPEFAVPALRAAAGKAEVVAVYTQPDRPSGRGRVLTPSPVKRAAQDMGFPVMQPDTLRAAEVQEALRALKPDLMVVVAYGLLLPQAVLDIPVDGCWNVHASLLPRWRGAAPIQRAIEAGDTETGVCLMRMEKGLDTGPVLLEQRTPIGEQVFADRPCFLLTDHIPMPKKAIPGLERMGATKITLGPTMLFASQCVVLIHHALDQR